MAKNESTAVNELIDLVQAAKPMSEPSDNLFGSPKLKSTRVNPPRMSATVPPMRGAGEVAPLPRMRAPSGTSSHTLPAMPPVPVRISTAPASRASTIPPLPRVAEPIVRVSRPVLPPPNRTTQPALSPVAAPFEAKRADNLANPFVAIPQYPLVARPTVDQTGDAFAADDWFEQSRAIDKVDRDKLDETWLGTLPVAKRRRPGPLAKKLIAPAAVLAVLGVLVGGYVAFDGEAATHHAARTAPAARPATPGKLAAAAPTPVAAPEPAAVAASPESANAATATAGAEQPQPPPKPGVAPAPIVAEPAPGPVAAAAPVTPSAPAPAIAPAAVATAEPALGAVREVQTTRGVVKLVDVRIDSKPAGATIMLVDNGKTSFLGTTPVSASVDPARTYDVVFTLENRPTQMIHLEPTKTHHLDIALGKPPAVPAAAAAVAEAPAHHYHAAAKVRSNLAEPSFDAPAQPTVATKPAAPSGSTGTLMVSSKPPCELVVDGKPTGLSTPQRALALPPGIHKITFVNAAENIKKTVAVAITADQSTKLIQNLMK